MTAAEIEQFLAVLQYDRDDRNPADNRRRGRFQAGWENWSVREHEYTDETLRILTWDNLGFRFAQRFGSRPRKEIMNVYEIVASFHQATIEGERPLPDEVPNDTPLVEGAVTRIIVNAYERNPEARRRCLAAHGSTCSICGINFGQRYGLVAEGYIHVHHLRPLSEVGERYVVNPENDLRPVCPNCHAVIHLRRPPFGVEELRGLLAQRTQKG